MFRKKLDFIFKLNDLFNPKEKFHFLVVMGVALVMAVFQAIGVASILPFINIVMDPSTIASNHWLAYVYQTLGFKSDSSFIIFSGFLVIGVLVVGNAVSAIGTWIKIHFVWQNNHELACVLLKKYLSMPYAYFLNHNTADLGKNVLMEVNHLSSGYLLPLINIIINSAITLVIFILLVYVNPLMTLFAVVFLILFYFLIYLHLSDKLKKQGRKAAR